MKPISPIKRLKEEFSHYDENVIRPTVIPVGDDDAVCSTELYDQNAHVSRISVADDIHNASARAPESRDSHFQECIRLHSAKKIDEKNAFSLYLIDYVHSMLMTGKLRNFQAATPLLAAGTTIYAARVDAVHKKCRKIASKLSHARLSSSPMEFPEPSSQRSGEPTPEASAVASAASTARRSHRTVRPRLLTSANLMRARLSRAPYDDLLFRQAAAAGDQTLADQAQLHGISGAEGEEAEEEMLRAVSVPFDPRLLQRGLEICPDTSDFVFLPEPLPMLRPCHVALSALELIKLSELKQELKEEHAVEEEEGDPPEELCLPHVVSVTGAVFPKEIVCQSVEEYVDLLRENFANLHSLPCAGDLPELHRMQRKSGRKRPHIAAYEGHQAQAKRKRVSQKLRAARRKRPRAVRCRVKVELREQQLAPEPPVLLEEPEEPEEEEEDSFSKLPGYSSDSEEDLFMSEPRFSFDALLCRPSLPSVDVSGLIRWLRRFLTVKCELGTTRRFAWILEHARSVTRRDLSPAMVLFALLHVAERERFQLRECDCDIEIPVKIINKICNNIVQLC